MGAVVGIDLGTTNTVVAAMRDGNPFAILDETGSSLIPSIVSFLPSGAVLVGNAAKERRTEDTKNTIFSVKRLIGRPWDSPEVRQARGRFSFELKEGPGRATFVVARNETFTLPEISAYVLRKAKSIAEIELGESVDRAVVTVPANFNDLQRAATKVAGRVAGLEILRILNEPTAAALAYGHNHGNAEKIAVFDFGGGTFDITLLSLTESVFEVLATAGNTFLGGDDLDWAIAEKIADEFSAHQGRDVRRHPMAIEHLRAAAETIKIQLTEAEDSEINIEIALDPGQDCRSLSFAMSRAEFERLATPLVDRAFDVCREALGLARVDIGEIDHVLLVGGCTRIPCVRRRVEEFFRRELDAHLNPHEVVALGAALQAHALSAARTSAGRIEVPPAPLPKASPAEATISSDWRQKTQPFGRLGSTNIGMGQTRDPGTADSIQVPAPEGVPSRPAPTTQNLGSRGRLNTAVGIGPTSKVPITASSRADDTPKHLHAATSKVHPAFNDSQDESDDGSDFEPEDLLPVVAATGQGAHVTPKVAPSSLAEPDDDEATTVRVFLDPAQDSEYNLPLVKPESPSLVNKASIQGDDDTVRFQKPTADLPELQPPTSARPSKSVQRVQESHSDSGLPAMPPSGTNISTNMKSSAAPPEIAAARSTKAPSTDELRQRYGDLPLIIGGKRLGTRASENPEQAPELPELRPSLDTMVDSSTVPPPSDEALPAVRVPRAPQPTTPDLNIHAELPLVGVGATEKHNLSPRAPTLGRPNNPVPARLPAKVAPSRASTPSSTGDVPISLNDNDLVEEPRSQPPSTARISVRPAMRFEPIAEAALPVPNLPEWDVADRPASFDSHRPLVPTAPQNKTAAASYPASRRRVVEGIDSARLVESAQPGPLASGVNLPPATSPIEAPRPISPVQASVRPASSNSARNEDVRQRLETSRLAPLIAGGPLASLPMRDMGLSNATASLPQQHYRVGVPLLIDVTPLSLCVETVGSYSDVLIDRNTPVPCERSREFVTVQDGQQVVRVRVAQGESRVFSENLPLGELELTGLRPAPRGHMRISVTFGLDSDGILHVRAIDLDTGRATTSELRLAGIPSSSEVAHMASRHLATS